MQHLDVAGQSCRVRRLPPTRTHVIPRNDLPGTSVPRDIHARDKGASVEQLTSVAALQLRLAELDPSQHHPLALIAEEGLSATDAHGIAIALSSGPEVVCCVRAGSLAPPLGTPINTHSGLSSECLRTGEIVCCEDTDNDPRADSEACQQAGIRSVLLVPIRAGDRVSGLLALFSRYIAAFGRREASLVQLLAGLVSSCTRAASAEQIKTAPTIPSLAATSPEKTEAESATGATETHEPAKSSEAKLSAQSRWASSKKVSECLERIRQDRALRVLGRAKAYLTIEALYDGSDRSHAIALFQSLMLQRSDELGIVL